MTNTTRARARRALVAMMVASAAVGLSAGGALAASKKADLKIAKAGVLTIGDFPSGFAASKPDTSSDAAVAKAAKAIPECGDYGAVRKLTDAQPKAKSQDFKDTSRTVSNEVDVFASVASARKALTLFSKDDVETCLNKLFEQVFTKLLVDDPSTGITSVTVDIHRLNVDGGGDQSAVYEGSYTINTKTTTQQIGIGFAAIRLGRAVDAFTYQTEDAPLTDLLSPLIDATLGRIRTALGK